MEYVYMIGTSCDDLYWGDKWNALKNPNKENTGITIFKTLEQAKEYLNKKAKKEDVPIKDLCEFIVKVKLQEEKNLIDEVPFLEDFEDYNDGFEVKFKGDK